MNAWFIQARNHDSGEMLILSCPAVSESPLNQSNAQVLACIYPMSILVNLVVQLSLSKTRAC